MIAYAAASLLQAKNPVEKRIGDLHVLVPGIFMISFDLVVFVIASNNHLPG